MQADGEVETKSESKDDQMSPFEYACDDDVEYLVEGESLVTKRALNAQVKEDEIAQKGRIFFTLDAMLITRYVV